MSTAAKSAGFVPAVMVGRESEAWKERLGNSPHTLWVGERPDKKWCVYVRWQEGRKPVWRSLKLTIRGARGEVKKALRDEVLKEATRLQADLVLGITPGGNSTGSGTSGKKAKGARKGSLVPTLAEGFTLALRSSQGIYVTETEQARDMRAAAEDVMAALTDADGPGGEKSWEEITPNTCSTVWRYILRDSLARIEAWEKNEKLPAEKRRNLDRPRGTGHRRAERAVGCLYQVARWLHDLDPSRYPFRAPRKGWNDKLQEEWRQKTGIRPDEIEKPRHTPEELTLILTRMEEADRRVALMIELGAEQRSGQAVRATRKDLNLEEGVGGFGLGQIDLRRHGYGKKEATVLDIHPHLRARLEVEFTEGYLSELERAFRGGVIPDYHLFPAGKLRAGVAPLGAYLKNRTHILQGTMGRLLRKYEEACGVEHVLGRGFYGLRRLMADEAGIITTDTRVLRQITGWRNEATRLLYLRKLAAEAVAGAGQVMHQIRQKHRAGTDEDGPVEVLEPGVVAVVKTEGEIPGEQFDRISHLLSDLGGDPPAPVRTDEGSIAGVASVSPRTLSPEEEAVLAEWEKMRQAKGLSAAD